MGEAAGGSEVNEPVNDYGVPLHACNGYRCDEHYWAWLGAKRMGVA